MINLEEYDPAKYKRCSRCGAHKLLTDFYKSNKGHRTQRGRQALCKQCVKELTVIRREIRNARQTPTDKPYGGTRYGCRSLDSNDGVTKLCLTCNTKQPLSNFSNHAASADGKNSRCKDCIKLYRNLHINYHTKVKKDEGYLDD